MTVAVIIPLYNGGPWIKEALDSILSQELVPDEIVVVDDGSTDASPEIVRTYKSVKLFSNKGKGSSVARNLGLNNTRSNLLAFLDQDDVWHPAHLRLLVEALSEHSEANTAVATASCFKVGIPDYNIKLNAVGIFDPWTRFPFTIGVDGPSLAVIRREAILKSGLWEECATGMGDALLFLKLAAIHPLLQLSCRTVGKRIHASQQWLQVRELGVPYLGFRYDVMKRALNFRFSLNHSDPDIPHYKAMLETLCILQELTMVIESDRLEAVPYIAHQLESRLRNESLEYLPHAFYCLMGALFKTYDAECLQQERDRVFLRLLDYWPSHSRRTREVLRTIIGERPYVS